MNPFEKNWDGTVTEEEKKAYTEIVIVFDKSGSMEQLKQASGRYPQSTVLVGVP